MCWKYEPLYDGQCFDYIGFLGFDECLIDFLSEHYDIKVLDPKQFTTETFKFLTILHENGIIEPIHPTGEQPLFMK